MPHVWLIPSLCCCLMFSGLQFACPPVLHVLLLLGIDKKIKKRGLAYKLGMFLWLVYCLISKNVNNIWYLLFSLFMFCSTAHRIRMVSVHKEVKCLAAQAVCEPHLSCCRAVGRPKPRVRAASRGQLMFSLAAYLLPNTISSFMCRQKRKV